MSPPTVSVIRPVELSPELWQRWREIQRGSETLASPYYHPAYTLAIARERDDVHIAIVERDDEVVAFFPHQSEGGSGISVGDHLTDYEGPISAEPWHEGAAEFLRACGLRHFHFAHLPAAGLSYLRGAARPDEGSPWMDLGGGPAAYLARVEQLRGRPPKWYDKAVRQRRRLEADVGELTLDARSLDSGLLDATLELKQGQYERTGGWSAFLPWAERVLRYIATHDEPGFTGMLTVLRTADRVVASHLGMRGDGVLHWWFPTYDWSLRRYSPGLVLLAAIVGQASDLGVDRIDLGKGYEAYKQRVMTGEHALFHGEASTADSG